MSNTGSLSPFEALPPEIFNHVLEYLFDPAQCVVPETSAAFRSYRFYTAILRVCKGIYNLAKSHLHHSLSWIRFDINWDALLIEPHWLSIPCISITREDTPKALSLSYVGDQDYRGLQDAPPGRIAVRIKFPPPVSGEQKKIRNQCFNSPFVSFMSILILEENIDSFLLALRMNDLAYCERILPRASLPTKRLSTRSTEGMAFDIQVFPGQEPKRYRHLISKFSMFQGPFHEMYITGSGDKKHAQAVALTAGLRLPTQDRRQQILDAKQQTYTEGIKLLIYLKHRGDMYLRDRQHANAWKCYHYAMLFEDYWWAHDNQPETETYWEGGQDIYETFGLSLACNMTLAHTAGALNAPDRHFRGQTVVNYCFDLMDVSVSGTLLGQDRYLELVYTMMTYHLGSRLTLYNIGTPAIIEALRAVLILMMQAWEHRHAPGCSHKKSTTTGRIYACVKAMATVANLHITEHFDADLPTDDGSAESIAVWDNYWKVKGIKEKLDEMRGLLKDAGFEPLKWAIHEDHILDRLRPYIAEFLPKIQILPDQISATDEWDVVFPRFNQASVETLASGEDAPRYLI